MTLEGRQLGRYQIVRLLGSGGMGEVWLGEDARIRQQVAIKVIRAEQSPYPNAPSAQTAVRLFQREARAIVALDHPHILPLHDYGEEPQGKAMLIYLVMPYRPEGSLVDWVQQRYPDRLVPPEVVAHLVRQAAEALQHAHDHQIIHQDVKPSNFLVRENSKDPDNPDVLLADFGIARIASATASTSQAIRGTPTYMAPEQCEGEAFPASDQYALAVMAYELLTGRPPFQGNAMRLMYQHVNAKPEPASAHNARLSGAVDEALLTALSKRPEERFASATAFAHALQQAVAAMDMADAATRISAAPLPRITSVLPDTPLISNTLADAVTKITPQAVESTPSALVAPDVEVSAAPDAQGWAAAHTEPTAPDMPETINLGKKKESGPIAAAPSAGWAEETGAPTAPSLPDTISLEGNVVNEEEAAAPSAPVVAHRRSGKRRFILIAAAAVIILALVSGGTFSLVPGILSSHPRTTASSPVPASSAIVTLTPASKDLQKTYTLSAVTGTPDTSQQQVGARMLSLTTQTYAKTVNATGTVNFPGTYDHGTVIVSNYDPVNPLSFAAGDTIADEGSCPPVSGGKSGPFYLMFDAPVSLPVDPDPNSPNNPPTAFVPGHIVEVGSWGGCFAADIYCASYGCYAEVGVSSNFGGGQDPYNGPAVQQSDINNAANSLIAANQPDPQQVLQGQIQSNERMIGTPQCSPNISSDHNAGDWVAQVTVTVSFTCTGEVYDHDGALAMAANLLTQQAATDPGAGYTLVGQVKTALANAILGDQGTVTLTVSAEGVWAYQFTDAQKQALAQLIVGETKEAAQQTLASQPGVAQASIALSGGVGQTLPTNSAKIEIVVLGVSGA